MWYDFYLEYKNGQQSNMKWGTAPNLEMLKKHVKREYKNAVEMTIIKKNKKKIHYKLR